MARIVLGKIHQSKPSEGSESNQIENGKYL